MSVNLKLADQDAQLVADILGAVSFYTELSAGNKDTVGILRQISSAYGSVSMRARINEIKGAFMTVVRANK